MAAPLIAAGAIMAGSSLLGGYMANQQSKKAEAAQAAAINNAINQLNAVGIPPVEAQEIVMKNPELVYQFSPELMQAVQLEQTKMGQVQTDPRLAQAQMDALSALQERAQGGMTPEDIAQFRNLQRQVSGQAAARDASILQNMQERGVAGSGAELASRLASSQQAQQMAAQSADELAAQNYQAKMQALQAAGQMGGQMRGQEFEEQAKKATAEDMMKQFNAQYLAQARQQNVQAQNEAAQQREKYKQDIANKVAENANQEAMYNKGLIQKKYENEMAKAGAVSNIYGQQAQLIGAAGAAKAKNTMDMFSGAGTGIASMFGGKK